MTGYIKIFDEAKRYGFICSPGLSDVFFGSQDLGKELDRDETLQNRRVSFEMRSGPKGPIAVHIRPAH